MASKVNTRFILLFVLLLGLALALLGGVYVLRLRGDATRNFRRGEEAFAKGDYKAASDQFGRALHKEPGNAEYLQRLEASIVKLVPQNAGVLSAFSAVDDLTSVAREIPRTLPSSRRALRAQPARIDTLPEPIADGAGFHQRARA